MTLMKRNTMDNPRDTQFRSYVVETPYVRLVKWFCFPDSMLCNDTK